MSDQLIRAVAPGLRLVAAITTDLVNIAARRHCCSAVATAALGRTMTAALLLAETFKGDEALTVRISGDGPLGDVIADIHQRHCVRGYVRNPGIELPLTATNKLPVGQGVGEGMIHVTRFNPQREVFTGTVRLITGEIAEDVTRYLLESEQIPSTVGLGVLVEPNGKVTGAAGFLVQAMPDASDETLTNIERNLALVGSPSHLAAEGINASGFLRLLTAGLNEVTMFEPEPVWFRCNCSSERVEGILRALDTEELLEMIKEGQAEVHCNFCNEAYRFDRDQLQGMLNPGI